MKKSICIVTPCYNEEDNVEPLAAAVREVFEKKLPEYSFEHLFIDNASTDRTREKLRALAATDPRIKLIFNMRNFGHIRSPYHGLLQSHGDASIMMVADFQDPPEMIVQFIREWEKGNKVVVAIKTESSESPLMFAIRKAYYNLVSRLADVELIKNFTGFGLYDQSVVKILREVGDPYPYFRGLITDLGFPITRIPFHQPTRRRGVTKNNFYTLYDIAMLGITNHSKVPLRLATMLGFLMSALSLLIAFGYLVAKLMFWDQFMLGTAPLLIGIFFFSSVQLFFIGIIGEYIGSIHTQVQKRPLVIESERVGF